MSKSVTKAHPKENKLYSCGHLKLVEDETPKQPLALPSSYVLSKRKCHTCSKHRMAHQVYCKLAPEIQEQIPEHLKVAVSSPHCPAKEDGSLYLLEISAFLMIHKRVATFTEPLRFTSLSLMDVVDYGVNLQKRRITLEKDLEWLRFLNRAFTFTEYQDDLERTLPHASLLLAGGPPPDKDTFWRAFLFWEKNTNLLSYNKKNLKLIGTAYSKLDRSSTLFYYLVGHVLNKDSSFQKDLMNEIHGFFEPFAKYFLAGGSLSQLQELSLKLDRK